MQYYNTDYIVFSILSSASYLLHLIKNKSQGTLDKGWLALST